MGRKREACRVRGKLESMPHLEEVCYARGKNSRKDTADGRVWRTQPEELVTWHAHAANLNGLAICCDLGPGQKPTDEQVTALNALLDHLCLHRPDIPAGRKDVWGHGELHKEGNKTTCPGGMSGRWRHIDRGNRRSGYNKVGACRRHAPTTA